MEARKPNRFPELALGLLVITALGVIALWPSSTPPLSRRSSATPLSFPAPDSAPIVHTVLVPVMMTITPSPTREIRFDATYTVIAATRKANLLLTPTQTRVPTPLPTSAMGSNRTDSDVGAETTP